MTMDSMLSGDAENAVAERWHAPGRIAAALQRWRPECERELDESPDRAIWEWRIQNERRRHVSKFPRGVTSKAS